MIKISKKYKKRKRKISKKALIVAVIMCMIAMLFVLIDSLNNLNDIGLKDDDKIVELSNTDKVDDYDILEKYNCENISKEYENRKVKLNITFEKDLYTKNTNNKKYFENIIEELHKLYKDDFYIVDNEKGIKIEVKSSSENNYTYTINEIEDYFIKAEDENKKINNYKEIETIDSKVTYEDFNKFQMNEWSVKAAGVEILEKSEGELNYGTYKVVTDNIFINTIILNSDFQEEIIEGIKVTDSFELVKEKLGNPTFEENNMIGYKTDDEYIFFYNNEVAIYPNINFSNSELEKLLFEYIDGNYGEERKNFAFDIIHSYYDFKSYVDEKNSLNLVSTTRGIEIKIFEDNKINVLIYNNYDMTEKTKEYIREGKVYTNFDEDLINKNERNRVK